MQRLWEILFGIEAPTWTEGGQWRLSWLSLPSGDEAMGAVLDDDRRS